MRILVDMDGVIADFEGGFLKNWREKYPDYPFIPIEERTIFHIRKQYPEELQGFVRTIYCAPQFFRLLEPIPGSAQALNDLRDMGHEVFICTSQLIEYQHCVLEKFEWVNEHLGGDWTDKMVLTRDKTIVNADILIDDRPDISGVAVPTWEHVLYDQPYNRMDTAKRRLIWQDWRSVLFPLSYPMG